MKRANTGVFAAFLLVFLFLLVTVIPLLLLLFSYGFLQLPKLTYYNITIAATTGLFIIPVFLVFLAAVIALAAKRKGAAVAAGLKPRREPEPYPWESVFGAAGKEDFKAVKVTAKTAFTSPKPSVTVLAVAAVIVAATVVFFVMVVPTAKDVFTGGGKGSNLTVLANLSAGISDNVVKNESASSLFQFFKAKLSNLRKTNMTGLAEEARIAEAKKLAELEKAKQKQEKEAKQKEQKASSFSALAAKFNAVKAAAVKVSAFWPYALAGISMLVMLAGGFYFYRAKKVKPAAEWVRTCVADSAGWLAVLFSDVKRNGLKLLIIAAVVLAAALAFVFRSWLKAKLPAFSKVAVPVLAAIRESAISFFYAARNFLLAYRIYILIGIAVLLVIFGILFVLERKGKEAGTPKSKT
ncbi:hypothetical protein HYV85_05245 [Candidatus Woesearchaeota archaeon]|nr:hypothetical protein [Candidatus Woesearchaeota archaeon]